MLHAVLTFAAAANEDGAAEPSKVPFYVAGMVLVAFAVLIGALGIVKHDFPATRGVRNAVLAVGTLLVLAAMATSVLTS
jgi:hypothetical protein